MKPIVLEDWRRRVSAAERRGKFTKDDVEVIIGSPCGCIKGELGRILCKDSPYKWIGDHFPITDELESIMIRAVRHNDISTTGYVLDIMEQIPSLYHVQR